VLKDKIIAVCLICLSVSIIISANIIAKGMKNNGVNILGGFTNVSSGLNNIVRTMSDANSINEVNKRNTIDLATAANYLGITEDSLMKIINNKKSGIPYIKMGEFYILSKDALNKWLETARVEIE
jgi:excisionase family DNA binding protein